jgi:hypothetical protein
MKNEFYSKKIVIIVGGFLNGKYLPLLFNGLGYSCVHITERRHLENHIISKGFDGECYEQAFVLDKEDDVKEIIEKFGERVACVIAGSEPSVELADRLNSMLGLAGIIQI